MGRLQPTAAGDDDLFVRLSLRNLCAMLVCVPLALLFGCGPGPSPQVIQRLLALEHAAKASLKASYTATYSEHFKYITLTLTYAQSGSMMAKTVQSSSNGTLVLTTPGPGSASVECATLKDHPSHCYQDNSGLGAWGDFHSPRTALADLQGIESDVKGGQSASMFDHRISGLTSYCFKGQALQLRPSNVVCFTSNGIIAYLGASQFHPADELVSYSATPAH